VGETEEKGRIEGYRKGSGGRYFSPDRPPRARTTKGSKSWRRKKTSEKKNVGGGGGEEIFKFGEDRCSGRRGARRPGLHR